MHLFSKNDTDTDCGLIVDIGSGSVGVAIVLSNKKLNTVETVWTHREYILIKEIGDARELLREINTALINALLEFGNNGLKTLAHHERSATIKTVQCTFSAPWSYTASRTISYDGEKQIVIQEDFLEDLINADQHQSANHTETEKIINELGLRKLSEKIAQITLNDYIVENPIGKKASKVSLTLITSAVQEKILSTLEQSCSKIIHKVEYHHYSFIDIFYQTLRFLKPDTSEVCIIDITNEASEVGIIRDNVLRNTNFISSGLYSISRAIAKVCNIPNEEAFSLMKNGTLEIFKTYPQNKQAEIDAIFKAYEDELSLLFKDTKDGLSIPQTLFVHTSTNTEVFFSNRVKNAAESATNKKHVAHLVTKELFSDIDAGDSALALSTHFFHSKHLNDIVEL